jgi:hypothetical protein
VTEDEVIYYYERKMHYNFMDEITDERFKEIGLKISDYIDESIKELSRPHTDEMQRRFPKYIR